MNRRKQTPLAVMVMAVAILVALPALAFAQSSDQKAARIKAGLEREGLKVLQVTYLPADSSGPAHWFAVTAAVYSRPAWPDVAKQALVSWLVMNETTSADLPDTVLISGQVWTKYVIQLGQKNSAVTEFASALKAAKSDADKDKAVNAVLKRFLVRVYDTQREQFVDVKDFVNKNFAD